MTVLCSSGIERSVVCIARFGLVLLRSDKEYLEQ